MGQFEEKEKKNEMFPQRRKDAKKARKGVEAIFILNAFFASSLRLCAFAGDSFVADEKMILLKIKIFVDSNMR